MRPTCNICQTEFLNNRGGQLTNHLNDVHSMSLEDYYVQFELNGIEPKCECGLCDQRPLFSRGKFKNLALFHNRPNVRQKLYLIKFGEPKCEKCNVECGFRQRGTPKRWCKKCSYTNGGFNNPLTQEKIRQIVQEKYGVDNVSKLDEIKQKIGKSNTGKSFKMNELGRSRISQSTIKKWQDPDYKKRMSNAISVGILNSDKRDNRHPPFRLSKLHQRIRTELDLDELGFVSERCVHHYWADELNEQKKFIIEINGDYVHANPLKFKADDVIRLYGQSYTALEKWSADALRKKKLENAGYVVFVIWESDDLEHVKCRLNNLLISHETVTKSASSDH